MPANKDAFKLRSSFDPKILFFDQNKIEILQHECYYVIVEACASYILKKTIRDDSLYKTKSNNLHPIQGLSQHNSENFA